MRSHPKPPTIPPDPRTEPEDEGKEHTVVFGEERTAIVSSSQLAEYAKMHTTDFPENSSVRPVAGTAPRGGSADPLEAIMFEHLAKKDYSAALFIAGTLLEKDPTHKKAQLCQQKCQVILEHKYVEKMGSLKSVPIATVNEESLRAMTLDHRAAFLLSLVDGATDLDTLLDLSAMPRLEAVRLLYELSIEGLVRFPGT